MSKITILVASSNKNAELGNTILKAAEKVGHQASIMNLEDLDLPMYTAQREKDGLPSQLSKLQESVFEAESLVIVGPEYNGLVAPTLNNAIAWLSVSDKDWRKGFNGKPTLIGTHSGGAGSRALIAMRLQLSYIGANVIGREISTTYNKELNPDSLTECLKQL
jgi:NAD(P)H-dependent FMN reductase